jgi:hypothetical protein
MGMQGADPPVALLDYALAYARRGWHVLPLEPRGKAPLGRLAPHGAHNASRDRATIENWWRAEPQANIGIALAPSRLVVIDVDPRHGGNETFERLQREHGSLRSDVYAFTGGGGEHHLFAVPADVSLALPGKLGPGVDLKGNGYIVAEPSLHPSGRRYGWEACSSPLDGVEPSALPPLLRQHRAPRPSNPQVATPDDALVALDPARALDAREALRVLDADDYDTWLRAGMALHSTDWGAPAFEIWSEWSQTSPKFNPDDCRRRWSGFKSDTERQAPGLSLAWIFKQAKDAGWVSRCTEPEPTAALDGGPSDVVGVPLLSLAQLQKRAGQLVWSVKNIIPANAVGMLFGASGTFKSFLALDYALHVAHGLPWLGRKTRPGAVIYIAAEGGAGLWRRIDAWHQVNGLQWSAAPFYAVPVALTLLEQASEVVKAAQALQVEPAVVIVDTMSQTFSGEENSASDVAVYLRELAATFRDLWRCTTLVIHHSGHAATERPRGSSAIIANTDFLLGVFRDPVEKLARLECHKQKDEDRFEPLCFALQTCVLGVDDDGDPIRSLVARHLLPGGPGAADVARLTVSENGSYGELALSLLRQAGGVMPEAELRQRFYERVKTKDRDMATVNKAWRRTITKKHGFLINEQQICYLPETAT